MATSINAIGGVTFNGYPGPIVPTSDTTYATNGTDPTDLNTNPIDGGNPPNSLNPYDLDGNGTVSPQEYQRALGQGSTALPTTTFAALTAGADSDGDGIPDPGDTNDFVPDQGTANSLNGGLDGGLQQNPVVTNLATQTYGAIANNAIDQAPPQQQSQQQLSLLAY